MKKNIFRAALSAVALSSLICFSSCDDLLNPAKENIRGLDAMDKEPSYAQGFFANAYILLPYSSSPGSDLATDDAVSNDIDNGYLKMATGSWTSDNDPMSQWQARRNAIQYINIFLEHVDKVEWAKDENVKTMFRDRFKGEAYALRALQLFYLLRAHAGVDASGNLMGVPIVTHSEAGGSDFNTPRSTFADCIDSIYADANRALALLPLDYGDVSDDEIPAKYRSLGVTHGSDYNRVCGDVAKGRISTRIVEALLAQVSLFAASPAYSNGSGISYDEAAKRAAVVLNRIGGVSGLDPKGYNQWFTDAKGIKDLANGDNFKEVLWRGGKSGSDDHGMESDNYPPSIYGKGRVNPTQNLVDAFPALNGYPITDAASNYDPNNPYENRDPRLAAYIVVNGSKIGSGNAEIITGVYGTNKDVINKENGYSTRTGYYLRKSLRADCNLDPSTTTGQEHISPRIRYTEIFLDYAEAANEAYGPTGNGGNQYSAYDVIKAIRQRAGIGLVNNDAYLESVKNDKAKMRELIRNERRLELCFENHRFYDLRRWKVDLSKLNETAKGVEISKADDGSLLFKTVKAEERSYKDYMYYGPIPYQEALKWSNLTQNVGWQ
jgi:hypothetical protein